MLQNVLLSMIVMMRKIIKGWYTKKKGFNKKNFFSKQDKSDQDGFVVIKNKSTNHFTHRKGGNDESDEENYCVGSQEVLFLAFTNDDDSDIVGNVDEFLMNAIE